MKQLYTDLREIYKKNMEGMNTISFASKELIRAKVDDLLHKLVLDLVIAYTNIEKSKYSLVEVLSLFNRVNCCEPLTAIEDIEEDWKLEEAGVYSHKRYVSLFKTPQGFYDLNATLFKDRNGESYADSRSIRKVELPYYPTGIISNIIEDKQVLDFTKWKNDD